MSFRLAVALAALTALAAPSFADLEARAEFGADGVWISEAVTPLTLDLANSGAEPLLVEIEVSHGDAMALRDMVHRRVVEIAPAGRRSELFLIPGPQNWGGRVEIHLAADPGVPIHAGDGTGDRGELTFEVAGTNNFQQERFEYSSHVLAVVGDERGVVASRFDALGLSRERGQGANSTNRKIHALRTKASVLRLAPLALDGADALLLCDPDAAALADPAALDGVLDWVALGGNLVVSLGDHASEFNSSPLAAHLPARWTGARKTSYASLVQDLDAALPKERLDGPWVELAPLPGALTDEAPPHDGLPTLVSRPLGLGRVVVLAYDLRALLAATSLTESDARRVLAPFVAPDAEEARKTDDSERWRRSGFTGSLARVLQEGAFDPPPVPLVVFGIVVYVVVVGPLDWFLLKRLRKQRLTTFTFLGAVLAFTLLAYGASLLLFSSGARTNRVVFADLTETGREGRQLLTFTDIAGYYSPTGSDQPVAYQGASTLLAARLPGSGFDSSSGSPLPVQIAAMDPIHPQAKVLLAFRSQRVVRAASVQSMGPTLEIEWQGTGDDRAVRVTNGLPVDLDDVAVFLDAEHAVSLGPIAAGAASDAGAFKKGWGERPRTAQMNFSDDWGNTNRPTRDGVRCLLESMTTGDWQGDRDWLRPGYDEARALRKAGFVRDAAFQRGHALIVAHASKLPVPLPGSDVAGETYVVLRKEVPIP